MTEKKAVDLANTSYGIDSTGSVTAINLIQTGSGYNNRVGRKINLTSVEFRGSFIASGTFPVAQQARVMIVYDKQPNGSLPAIGDVLQAITQAGATETRASSPRNLDKRDRFVCLWDHWCIMFGNHTNGSTVAAPTGQSDLAIENTDQQTTNVHKYVRLPNLVTQYQADSSPAVIGDIATGSLFLLTFGQNAAGAGSHSLSGTIRLRYKDM